jgi:hypothetical protein
MRTYGTYYNFHKATVHKINTASTSLFIGRFPLPGTYRAISGWGVNSKISPPPLGTSLPENGGNGGGGGAMSTFSCENKTSQKIFQTFLGKYIFQSFSTSIFHNIP